MRNLRRPSAALASAWVLFAFTTFASLGCSGLGAFSAAGDAGDGGPGADAAAIDGGEDSVIVVRTGDAGMGDAGPGDSGAAEAAPTVLDVTPGDSKLGILRSLLFSASLPVTWSVQEGAAGGSVDATGKYVSPPIPGTYHLVATATSDPTVRQTATLTVVGLDLTVVGGVVAGEGNIDGAAAIAHFVGPTGVAYLDGWSPSSLLVLDNETVRAFNSTTQRVTTIAGTPGVTGTTAGTGAVALFNGPNAVAVDNDAQKVWVSDAGNHCIRTVDPSSGAVTTFTGQCGTAGHVDGLPPAAMLGTLAAMVLGPRGDALYVCEEQAGAATFAGIRRIDAATGQVTSILGGVSCAHLATDVYDQRVYFDETEGGTLGGGIAYFSDAVAGGPGVNPTIAALVNPIPGLTMLGMAAETGYGSAGAVFTLSSTDPVINRYQLGNAAFDTTPFAGSPTQAGPDNGTIAGARFESPVSLTAVPATSTLYVADAYAIRDIDLQQSTVGTPLGSLPSFVAVDGPPVSGRLTGPIAVAADPAGNLYVADVASYDIPSPSRVIRKIDPSGTLTTLSGLPTSATTAGTPVDGPAASATFGFPQSLVYVAGTLYVVDVVGEAIRAVDVSDGSVSTLAGKLGVSGDTDGVGGAALFDFYAPNDTSSGGGIATDGKNLYVADPGNYAVRQIVIATGQVSTLAGGTKGTANGTGNAAQFLQPLSVAYDRGTLYVADGQDDVIRQIDLGTGAVTTLVGLSGEGGSADGDVSSATFDGPFDLLADGLGSLYVVEAKRFLEYRLSYYIGPGLLRRVDLATATVSTVAGTRGQQGVAPGPAPSTLNCPAGLALTPAGDTLVSDPCDGVVVRLSAL